MTHTLQSHHRAHISSWAKFMKITTTPLVVFIGLCGCGMRAAPEVKAVSKVVEADSIKILSKRIGETGHVEFKSWDGRLKGIDSDHVLHFYKGSRIVLESMGYAIAYYEGKYEVRPNGRITVTLVGYHGDWPAMILRCGSDDLLLYREDGETSRFPGDPYPKIQGFWPFSSS